jgi:hypothetical protein
MNHRDRADIPAFIRRSGFDDLAVLCGQILEKKEGNKMDKPSATDVRYKKSKKGICYANSNTSHPAGSGSAWPCPAGPR